MFNMVRRQRAAAASSPAASNVLINVTPTLLAALARLGERWRCGPETVAQRIIVLALTGWKPQHAELLEPLSGFVTEQEDPFASTCLMLRHHFDAAEVELGEAVRECDRVAWLGTLLETLRELWSSGEPARLSDLLADGAVNVKGGI